MSVKKHNNSKSNIIWAAIMIVIAGLLVLAVMKKRALPVKKMSVYIESLEGKRNLITKKDVHKIFRNFLGYDVKNTEVNLLPIRDMEQLLVDDRRVRKAEVFIDNRNVLQVKINQRRPIIRVAAKSGASYYLDQDGVKLGLRKGSAIRVPLATGNIDAYKNGFVNRNKENMLKNIFLLAQTIDEDKDFLSPLIEQIHVDDNNEIVLIPKLGRQKIHFGAYEDIDEKLYKLKVFYRDGLPKEGWSKYEVLRLDYKDQVRGHIKM